MTEEYIGTKFNTVFLEKRIPENDNIKKLIFWGKKFSLLGLTPTYEFGAAGNLSFKTETGYFKEKIQWDTLDINLIRNFKRNTGINKGIPGIQWVCNSKWR